MKYPVNYSNTNSNTSYTVTNRITPVRYRFKRALSKISRYPFVISTKKYCFKYAIPEKSKYPFSFKKSGIGYRFKYRHEKGRGLYRFKYNVFNEIYHEKTLVSFMYPEHIGFVDSVAVSFMYPVHSGLIKKDYYLLTLIKILNGWYAGETMFGLQNTSYGTKDSTNFNLSGVEISGEEQSKVFQLSSFKRQASNEEINFFMETNVKESLFSVWFILETYHFLKETIISAESVLSVVNTKLSEFEKNDILLTSKNENKPVFLNNEHTSVSITKQAQLKADSVLKKYRDMLDLGLLQTFNLENKFIKDIIHDRTNILGLINDILEIIKDKSRVDYKKEILELSYEKYKVFLKADLKEFFRDMVIRLYMRAINEIYRNSDSLRADKDNKPAKVFNIIHDVEKVDKDILNDYVYFLLEKASKSIVVLNSSKTGDKKTHRIEMSEIEKLSQRKKVRDAVIQELTGLLESFIFKELFNDFYSLLETGSYRNEPQREVSVYDIIKLLEKHTARETNKSHDVTADFDFTRDAFFISEEKLPESESSHQVEVNNLVSWLIKYASGYIEKSIFTAPVIVEINILKSIIAANDMKNVDLQNEHEFNLWQRFWFLYAGDVFDKKILPCHDFPYEEEPIEFTGFDDLLPENWQVVYPETFWLSIDHHPIPKGKKLGLNEIPLAINIMIDIINILILMWYRFYHAFWGWTGTQAVMGITEEVYKWLQLTASRNEQDIKDSRVHYDRCYRWLRWEAEKVSIAARNDMELRGNYYVGILLEEMINYMLDHHFDVMPIFEDVNKMDEWRRSFDKDLQNDITWVLDKVKGIRHKLIIGKEKKENA